MKYAYKEINFRAPALALIAQMNDLIERYQAQGYTLSVRQLYYQLVTENIIPNKEAAYKQIVGLLNDGRLAGLIDWDAIEDRNRDIVQRPHWDSAADIIDASARGFHMDMWDNQDHRIYVIVEKAALAGVLDQTCRKYDIPMLAARGYPSVSIIYELVRDHISEAIQRGQRPIILHLGDHDPSGIDMTRDLEDRIRLFLESDSEEVTLERIALNMDQIDEYQPPPNPAKVTDSRFESYMKEYGRESWELDALKPHQLVGLIESHVTPYIDDDRWADKEAEIAKKRKALTKTANEYKERDL